MVMGFDKLYVMDIFETIGTNQQIFVKCFQDQFTGTGKLLDT